MVVRAVCIICFVCEEWAFKGDVGRVGLGIFQDIIFVLFVSGFFRACWRSRFSSGLGLFVV